MINSWKQLIQHILSWIIFNYKPMRRKNFFDTHNNILRTGSHPGSYLNKLLEYRCELISHKVKNTRRDIQQNLLNCRLRNSVLAGERKIRDWKCQKPLLPALFLARNKRKAKRAQTFSFHDASVSNSITEFMSIASERLLNILLTRLAYENLFLHSQQLYLIPEESPGNFIDTFSSLNKILNPNVADANRKCQFISQFIIYEIILAPRMCVSLLFNSMPERIKTLLS